MTALWFTSVGDDCALFVDAVPKERAVAGGGGVVISNILRIAGVVSMSNMLRIGGLLIPPPPFVPGRDECLGAGGSISNMLLTGERGVAKGDPVRAGPPAELAAPLGLPLAAVPSRMAKTSFRSSSNTDSKDICLCAMIAVCLYRLRRRNCSLWKWLNSHQYYQAATVPRRCFRKNSCEVRALEALGVSYVIDL